MAANTIVLTWQDNSDSETGYKVYQSTDGINFRSPIATVGVGITTYVANIIEGQNYWFRVTAYNGAGESGHIQAGPLSCMWSFRYLFRQPRVSREII